MARGGVDPMVRYGVLGVLGFFGWNWASAQPANSPARQTVDEIRKLLQPGGAKPPSNALPAGGARAGSSAAASAAPQAPVAEPPSVDPAGHSVGSALPPIQQGQPMIATSLVDLGGFPLVLNPDTDALEQDPAQGGTNVYGEGDVVLDANGTQYAIVNGRGGPFLAAPDGNLPGVESFYV